VTAQELVAAIERGTGTTLWRQIAGALEQAVRHGEYKPGQQLPTEKELAERFQVNRHTVRQAMTALGKSGLVTIEQGRGMFVAETALDYVIGPRTRFSENLISRRRKPRRELLAAEMIQSPADVARALGILAGSTVWQIRTLNRADEKIVGLSTHYVPAGRFPNFAEAFRRTLSITAAFLACGLPDYRRKSTRVSARLAPTEEARLLGIGRNRPLLQTENINIDDQQRPVEFSRARFIADSVSLTIDHAGP